MTKISKVITTFLQIYYAYMVEYRAELFLWAMSGLLPLIIMGIWIEAAQSVDMGLTPVKFAQYFLAVYVVRQTGVVWVIWEFEKEVVEGKLSPKLLQPVDPVWHHLLSHIAERFARMPFIIGLIIIFFLLYPQAFWIPSWQQIIITTLVICLVFALRFLIQYTFALCSFWFEKATTIEQLWQLFYLVLSGMIAPLEVFPPTIRNIALITPFPYLINFPASILVGLPVNIGQGLLVVGLWSLLFWVLNRWLWQKGLKHYSGMGA
jgi:ABC-2 type transport system permease protein